MPLTSDGFYDAAHRIRVRFDLATPGQAKTFELEQGGLKVKYGRQGG